MICFFYKKPKFCTNVSQSLHVHPTGSHSLIFLLNTVRLFESLMWSGTNCHTLGPLNLIVSVPLKTLRIFVDLKGFCLRRLYGICLSGKMSLTRDGERSLCALYISVASFCRFLWWIVNDLSLCKSASKDRLESLYTSRSALSCNLFIRL